MYNCHLNFNNNFNSLHDFIHFYNRPNVNLSTHHSSLCSICLKSFTRRSDNCYFTSYQPTSFNPIVTFSSHPANSSTSCTARIPNHQANSPVIVTSNRPAPMRCTSNEETTTATPPAIYSLGYFTNQHTSVSVPPTFSSGASASAPATTSAPCAVSSQTVTQPSRVTDTVALEVFRNYGSGSLSQWLDSLRIPRNVNSLQQVKEIWECGSANCPPLQKWTVTMRNHRSETSGKNTSLFSQQKFIFSVFNLRHKHIIFTWRPYWCTACSLAYVKIQSDVGILYTCQSKINEFDKSVGENQVKLMEMIAMSFLYC